MVCTPGKLKKMGNSVVKQHSSVWRKRGLRDMGMEGGFTSRVADFDVTDTSQLQLLNRVVFTYCKESLQN